MIRHLILLAAATSSVAIAGACSQPPPLSMQAETASYDVQLDLDGASLGRRIASIQLTDAGRSPTAVERVVVSTAMPSMDMSGMTVVADKVDVGHFEATGALFNMAGESTLTVGIEGDGFDENATFTVEVES